MRVMWASPACAFRRSASLRRSSSSARLRSVMSNRGANIFRDPARFVRNPARHGLSVPDRPVWQNDPVFHAVVPSLLNRLHHHAPQRPRRSSGWIRSRLDPKRVPNLVRSIAKNAAVLVGPDHLIGREIPRPTARVADPLPFGQKGFAFSERVLRALSLHRDTGEMGKLLDDLVLTRGDLPCPARIDRDGSKYNSLGGQDRRGPAGSQAMLQGEVTVIGPKRVCRRCRIPILFPGDRQPFRMNRQTDQSGSRR